MDFKRCFKGICGEKERKREKKRVMMLREKER
jgi:hypothetical protein